MLFEFWIEEKLCVEVRYNFVYQLFRKKSILLQYGKK